MCRPVGRDCRRIGRRRRHPDGLTSRTAVPSRLNLSPWHDGRANSAYIKSPYTFLPPPGPVSLPSHPRCTVCRP